MLSAPAFAQNSEAPKYVVVVALSQAGQVVDAPSLTMSPGSAAYAQVDGRYRIDTRLTKGAGQRLTLEATIARPEAEQWIVVARPMLILNEGGRATVRLPGIGGDKVELTIQPAPSPPTL
ncbi:hypothetical protein WKI27_06805 [Brevundimonas vesicularis]|uniref:hypothetical protein n=1 Tax=Brevundimonas vesicularis TaxID=41276 RepID=UPI0030BC34C5